MLNAENIHIVIGKLKVNSFLFMILFREKMIVKITKKTLGFGINVKNVKNKVNIVGLCSFFSLLLVRGIIEKIKTKYCGNSIGVIIKGMNNNSSVAVCKYEVINAIIMNIGLILKK